MLRVTADTNIFVSAIVYQRGNPKPFVQMAVVGEINLTVSPAIVDELVDVLQRKFDATPKEIAQAREVVSVAARVVRPSVSLDVIKEVPPDNRIIECAVSAASDYIVTGDKDLLRLKNYDSIRILTVSDFLALDLGAKRER